MKKRGVKNRSRKAALKAAVRHKSVRKAKPKTRPRKAKTEAGPKRIKVRRSSTMKAAGKVLKKEEQVLKKDVRFLLSPEEFHVVTFVASLIILSFIFNATSLIFYSVVTIAALAFAHFLKQHHRPHDIITILGIFFLPLAVTIMAFRDVLVWLLLAVYLISTISTMIIYYVHKKAHTPLKIMWQVTYSRIIAVTLALILACIMPFLIPDMFLSVFEMIFVYILPVSFVFFFASKFFYIYFFDRKHIRHDLVRSFKHTVIYTLVFIVLLMCIYSVFATGFYNSRTARYDDNLNMALLGVSQLERGMLDLPEETQELMVVKDVSGFAASLREDISAEKNKASGSSLALADIVDDSYFMTLGGNAFNVLRFVVLQQELGGLKQAVLETKDHLEGFYGQFEDADGSMVDAYAAELKEEIDKSFTPFSQDADVRAMADMINDPDTDYSYFEDNGLLFWFADEAGLDSIYHSDSLIGMQASLVLRRSVPFRTLAQMTLNSIVFLNSEASSTSAVEYLYENRESDFSSESSAIRYSIMKADMEAREDRAEDAFRIDFKVD